jgi:hypothetical protein
VSWYELTEASRRALRTHLAAMADLFDGIRAGETRIGQPAPAFP